MVKRHLTDELPLIVVSLHEPNGQMIFWKSLILPESIVTEGDKWHHFTGSLPVKTDRMIVSNMVLKLYFWNKDQTASLIYDNVLVEVSGMN